MVRVIEGWRDKVGHWWMENGKVVGCGMVDVECVGDKRRDVRE